jgi:hypothetical protein
MRKCKQSSILTSIQNTKSGEVCYWQIAKKKQKKTMVQAIDQRIALWKQ